MKNIVLIICLFVFFYTNNLMSQDDVLRPKLAKPDNEISINGGLTFTNMSVRGYQPDGLPEYSDRVNISLIYGKKINEDISLFAGLEYLSLGYQTEYKTTSIIMNIPVDYTFYAENQYNYLNIPISAGYNINFDKFRIIPKMGFNLGYLLSLNYNTKMEYTLNGQKNVEEQKKTYTSEEIDNDINRLQVLTNIAIEFRYLLNDNIEIKSDLRYGNSLINVLKESNMNAKFDFYGLNLGLVYSF